MFSRQTPLLCPHCRASLPFSTYWNFFCHGFDYVKACPHCQGRMQHADTSLWGVVKFHLGGAIVQSVFFFSAFYFYLHKIEDSFWAAVFFALVCCIPVFLLNFRAYCRRLKLAKEA